MHPQKQKELYSDIRAAQSENLRVIVTTHSPYIVAETPFTRLGLVKKEGQHSALYIAEVKSAQEQETFDAYSDEVNSLLFFADKVVLVEGESDARAINLLMQKQFRPDAPSDLDHLCVWQQKLLSVPANDSGLDSREDSTSGRD